MHKKVAIGKLPNKVYNQVSSAIYESIPDKLKDYLTYKTYIPKPKNSLKSKIFTIQPNGDLKNTSATNQRVTTHMARTIKFSNSLATFMFAKHLTVGDSQLLKYIIKLKCPVSIGNSQAHVYDSECSLLAELAKFCLRYEKKPVTHQPVHITNKSEELELTNDMFYTLDEYSNTTFTLSDTKRYQHCPAPNLSNFCVSATLILKETELSELLASKQTFNNVIQLEVQESNTEELATATFELSSIIHCFPNLKTLNLAAVLKPSQHYDTENQLTELSFEYSSTFKDYISILSECTKLTIIDLSQTIFFQKDEKTYLMCIKGFSPSNDMFELNPVIKQITKETNILKKFAEACPNLLEIKLPCISFAGGEFTGEEFNDLKFPKLQKINDPGTITPNGCIQILSACPQLSSLNLEHHIFEYDEEKKNDELDRLAEAIRDHQGLTSFTAWENIRQDHVTTILAGCQNLSEFKIYADNHSFSLEHVSHSNLKKIEANYSIDENGKLQEVLTAFPKLTHLINPFKSIIDIEMNPTNIYKNIQCIETKLKTNPDGLSQLLNACPNVIDISFRDLDITGEFNSSYKGRELNNVTSIAMALNESHDAESMGMPLDEPFDFEEYQASIIQEHTEYLISILKKSPNLKKLTLAGKFNFNLILNILDQCPNLEELNLLIKYDSKHLLPKSSSLPSKQDFPKLQHLQSIKLTYDNEYEVEKDFIKNLTFFISRLSSKNPNIHTLTTMGDIFTKFDGSMAYEEDTLLESIKHLNLDFSNINNLCIPNSNTLFPMLESYTAKDYENDLDYLYDHQNISYVSLHRCAEIKPPTLIKLIQLKKLQKIQFNQCYLEGESDIDQNLIDKINCKGTKKVAVRFEQDSFTSENQSYATNHKCNDGTVLYKPEPQFTAVQTTDQRVNLKGWDAHKIFTRASDINGKKVPPYAFNYQLKVATETPLPTPHIVATLSLNPGVNSIIPIPGPKYAIAIKKDAHIYTQQATDKNELSIRNGKIKNNSSKEITVQVVYFKPVNPSASGLTFSLKKPASNQPVEPSASRLTPSSKKQEQPKKGPFIRHMIEHSIASLKNYARRRIAKAQEENLNSYHFLQPQVNFDSLLRKIEIPEYIRDVIQWLRLFRSSETDIKESEKLKQFLDKYIWNDDPNLREIIKLFYNCVGSCGVRSDLFEIILHELNIPVHQIICQDEIGQDMHQRVGIELTDGSLLMIDLGGISGDTVGLPKNIESDTDDSSDEDTDDDCKVAASPQPMIQTSMPTIAIPNLEELINGLKTTRIDLKSHRVQTILYDHTLPIWQCQKNHTIVYPIESLSDFQNAVNDTIMGSNVMVLISVSKLQTETLLNIYENQHLITQTGAQIMYHCNRSTIKRKDSAIIRRLNNHQVSYITASEIKQKKNALTESRTIRDINHLAQLYGQPYKQFGENHQKKQPQSVLYNAPKKLVNANPHLTHFTSKILSGLKSPTMIVDASNGTSPIELTATNKYAQLYSLPVKKGNHYTYQPAGLYQSKKQHIKISRNAKLTLEEWDRLHVFCHVNNHKYFLEDSSQKPKRKKAKISTNSSNNPVQVCKQYHPNGEFELVPPNHFNRPQQQNKSPHKPVETLMNWQKNTQTELEEKLKRHKIAIISGLPGIGKSYLATHYFSSNILTSATTIPKETGNYYCVITPESIENTFDKISNHLNHFPTSTFGIVFDEANTLVPEGIKVDENLPSWPTISTFIEQHKDQVTIIGTQNPQDQFEGRFSTPSTIPVIKMSPPEDTTLLEFSKTLTHKQNTANELYNTHIKLKDYYQATSQPNLIPTESTFLDGVKKQSETVQEQIRQSYAIQLLSLDK